MVLVKKELYELVPNIPTLSDIDRIKKRQKNKQKTSILRFTDCSIIGFYSCRSAPSSVTLLQNILINFKW